MEPLGINIGLLLIQLIPIVGIIGFPIISLLDLRKKKLSGATLAIWALIICAIPFIGSLAYWIIRPSAETR
ncbi:MAG: PLDc N-terminal domain-containing protein [Anaerolineales bacterium]|nr:PLDc N-terminal domain-containing protein [Anaerolineales bacterium]